MILPSRDQVAQTAIALVRGEVPWTALRDLGVVIQMEPAKVEVQVPPGMPIVEVSAHDVATGFLRHWAVGTELQEWAAVLLASGFIDFVDLEGQPGGDDLLEALWAASAREPISEEAVALARVMAENPPSARTNA